MTQIGTKAWGDRTDGRLSTREKLTMIGMVARSVRRDVAERLRARLPGHAERIRHVSLDAVPLPDSPIVERAREEAEDAYGGPLRRHCYRTYWWGALLAQVDGVRFDPEMLLVASLLHDLGIAPDGAPVSETCCFSVLGGRMAEEFLTSNGYDACRAVAVNEAISTHLNPVVSAHERTIEARLLAEGATLDVTGARSVSIPDAVLRSVDERYPRAGFIAEFADMSLRANHPSNTRPELLKRGFRRLVLRNRLDRM